MNINHASKPAALKSDGSEATWGWGGGLVDEESLQAGGEARFWVDLYDGGSYYTCLGGWNEFRFPPIHAEKEAPCENYPGLRALAGCTTSGQPILNWWPGPQFNHLELAPGKWSPSLADNR